MSYLPFLNDILHPIPAIQVGIQGKTRLACSGVSMIGIPRRLRDVFSKKNLHTRESFKAH